MARVWIALPGGRVKRFKASQVRSPQGNRMLFMVNERDPTGVVSSDLFVVNVDGTGPVNLTRNAAFDTEAVWVP